MPAGHAPVSLDHIIPMGHRPMVDPGDNFGFLQVPAGYPMLSNALV